MKELSDSEILLIDDIIDEWATPAVHLGYAAHCKDPIPAIYQGDDIFEEYYEGILNKKTATEMRIICLPKYIRRELKRRLKNE